MHKFLSCIQELIKYYCLALGLSGQHRHAAVLQLLSTFSTTCLFGIMQTAVLYTMSGAHYIIVYDCRCDSANQGDWGAL